MPHESKAPNLANLTILRLPNVRPCRPRKRTDALNTDALRSLNFGPAWASGKAEQPKPAVRHDRDDDSRGPRRDFGGDDRRDRRGFERKPAPFSGGVPSGDHRPAPAGDRPPYRPRPDGSVPGNQGHNDGSRRDFAPGGDRPQRSGDDRGPRREFLGDRRGPATLKAAAATSATTARVANTSVPSSRWTSTRTKSRSAAC